MDARGSLALSLWASRFTRRVGVGMTGDGSQWTHLAKERCIGDLQDVPTDMSELGAEHMVTNAQHDTQNQGKVPCKR